jgi:hypothetical protein
MVRKNVTNDPNCPCLEHGPRTPDITENIEIGTDTTDGRYADVTVLRCGHCRRRWLGYQVEYEAFTAIGRWCQAPIDDALAATMTPEAAPAYLAGAPCHIFGGSLFAHAGRRGHGPINWGL